jgi:hypothetical protein
MARRRGKIALLPDAVRHEVNRRLDDGHLYKEICAWLGEQGHGRVTCSNMSIWFHGGYQEWRESRLQAEADAAERDHLARFLKDKTASEMEKANLELASASMFDAMLGFQGGGLSKMTKDRPELFMKLVNSMALLDKMKRRKKSKDGGKSEP